MKFKNNACATGYAGSPNAEPCSSAGPYKLSGCTAFKCTRPTTPGTRTRIETLDAPGFKVTYTNKSVPPDTRARRSRGVRVRRAVHRERVHGVQVHAPVDAGVPRTRFETYWPPRARLKVTYTNNATRHRIRGLA